ncbi:MAG: TetR/AcrR family transcriptional regulator [Proteobacteria bacterium]|nr:TetR/AcrR family transcriptional regulator [Pseudomonadota bacterium]
MRRRRATKPPPASTSGTRNPKKRAPGKRVRLARAEREQSIVAVAVSFFAQRGFKGHTRELAARAGVTQPLLYRYFPSKEAIIERVYQEVFIGRWDTQWEDLIADRSRPLRARLVQFYQEYTRYILTYEWVRLFLFSGLEGLEINRRYLRFMRDRIWSRIVGEIRHEYARPTLLDEPMSITELELVWGVISSIFYIGIRRFVFELAVPQNLDAFIEDKIKAFFDGAPAAMAQPSPRHGPGGRALPEL